jgi:hypothetical protein
VLYAGPDHLCDMDRLSVLLHIPRIIDLCGDVPIQLVMYVLSGHDGSSDSRGSQEDTFWKIRDEQYDTIAADAIREKARLARIALRLNPEEISLRVLSIIANGNETVLQEIRACIAAARAEKQQKQQEALEGLPVARTNEEDEVELGMEVDTHDGVEEGTVSDNDSMEDALGVIE